MFSDDPCSNAQQWAGHMMRATPKGCRLVHFAVTFGSDGSCKVASDYSAPPRRQTSTEKTENVRASESCKTKRDDRGSKERRQIWRAHRQKAQQKRLLSTWEALKRAPPVVKQGRADVAAAAEGVPMDIAEKARPPPSVHPTPAAEQAVRLPPVTTDAPAPGATTEHTESTAQNAATTVVHTAHILSPRHESPLPPASTKRQKTYVEAASTPAAPPRLTVPSLPINTPLHTPNGTKGAYAGAQSLSVSPGGTQYVASYMERGGAIAAERVELQRLHFYP